MEKEIITKEHILTDINRDSFIFILRKFLRFFAFSLLYALIIFGFCSKKTAFYFFCILWALSLVKFLYFFITRILAIILVKAGKFKIANDWVVTKLLNKNYTLEFARSGKYEIYNISHYCWTENLCWSDCEFFDFTELSDDFYVIRFKSLKTIMVYNKKYFELDEELSTDIRFF